MPATAGLISRLRNSLPSRGNTQGGHEFVSLRPLGN